MGKRQRGQAQAEPIELVDEEPAPRLAKKGRKSKAERDVPSGDDHTPAPVVERIEADKDELKLLRTKIKEYEEAELVATDTAKGWNNHSQQVLDSLVGVVVRHMLFRQHAKPGQPVKREDLVAALKAERPGDKQARKLPGLIIPMAQAKMITTFGMEMREVTRQAAARRGNEEGSGSGTLTYVLQSLVPTALRVGLVDPPPGSNPSGAFGLAWIVLGLIQLNGDSMEAGALQRHLEQMGVLGDTHAKHPYFGADPFKHQMAELENRRLVCSSKQPGPEGQVTVYAWGEVAEDQIGRRAVQQWFDKAFKAAEQARPLDDDADEDYVEGSDD